MPYETRDPVERRSLKHWQDYLSLVNEEHKDSPAFIYRGQSNDWPLMASIDRLETKYPKKRYTVKLPTRTDTRYFDRPPAGRDEHLQAFKNASRGRVAEAMLRADDDEWWALARHHGLATPILDWTIYPLVALYFAFEEPVVHINGAFIEPEHRYVYRVSWWLIDNHKEGPQHPRIHFPAQAGTARMVAQGGVSLFMPELTYPEHCDLEQYVRSNFKDEEGAVRPVLGSVLEVIQIPSTDRTDCLKFLNKAAINRMTMYPDLDGSAAYINALWELDFDTSLGHFKPRVEESP